MSGLSWCQRPSPPGNALGRPGREAHGACQAPSPAAFHHPACSYPRWLGSRRHPIQQDLSGSRHDRSTRLPSLAYRVASASRNPCRSWAPAGEGLRTSHAASRNWALSQNCLFEARSENRYWKINDLRVKTFLFSVICDSSPWASGMCGFTDKNSPQSGLRCGMSVLTCCARFYAATNSEKLSDIVILVLKIL